MKKRPWAGPEKKKGKKRKRKEKEKKKEKRKEEKEENREIGLGPNFLFTPKAQIKAQAHFSNC
jgi:ribosomal protein L12E/L44/L45/RPP1/RPP2